MKLCFITTLALIAFAFNSILCRFALIGGEADAAGFTAVRLASGAAALIVIRLVLKGSLAKDQFNITGGSWTSAFLLFAYAVCFSFAYVGLTAGTGALVLFGSVQLTMIAVAIIKGERPLFFEWLGLLLAVCGLVYLVLPGLASPPLVSSLLMAAAGSAWGFYTLRGKGSADPLGNTTGNFVRSVPMVAIFAVFFLTNLHISARGVLLAVLSGAIASGVGYTVWYAALKHLTSTRAAVLQLAVPILVAAGGVTFMSEAATIRLGIAGMLILGGIALAILGRRT